MVAISNINVTDRALYMSAQWLEVVLASTECAGATFHPAQLPATTHASEIP